MAEDYPEAASSACMEDGPSANIEDEAFSGMESAASRFRSRDPIELDDVELQWTNSCKISLTDGMDRVTVKEMSALIARDHKDLRILQEEFVRSQLRQLQQHQQLMQRFLLEHYSRVEKALERNPSKDPPETRASSAPEELRVRKNVRISVADTGRVSESVVSADTSTSAPSSVGAQCRSSSFRPSRRRFQSQGTVGSSVNELNAMMRKRFTELQYGNLSRIKDSSTSCGRLRSIVTNTGSESVANFLDQRSRWCPFFNCEFLLKMVNSSFFAIFVVSVISVNAVFIGVATDLEIKGALDKQSGTGGLSPSEERLLLGLDGLFTGIFAVELMLRILASKQDFCFAADWHWNLFDTAIVATALLELSLSRYRFDLKYIRVLRLARVVRTLRVARLIPLFGKLRTLINALLSSIASLVWAVAVLVFLMFLFAIIFLQGATQYIEHGNAHPDHVEFLETFFASMGMALLSLFMCVTSGLSWWDVEVVLLEIHPVYGFLFVVYIATMVLSLLNIVTGICVNNALEMAQMDHDLMMKFELDRKAAYIESLEDLFHDLDANGSGTISFEDFTKHLEQHETSALFSVLGIEVSDAISFFETLDVDGSHELEIDEFVMGCLNLRGNVRTVDVATLMRENKKLAQRIGKVAKNTDDQLQDIIERLPRKRSDSGRGSGGSTLDFWKALGSNESSEEGKETNSLDTL